jgi:hypothetical protein
MAIAPNKAWIMLNPRNGICTNSSTASMALASSTPVGVSGDRRHASAAAAVDGTTVVANGRSPGSTHFLSPIGSSTATEGVPRPDCSMMVAMTPPAATNDSTATKIL